MRMAADKDLCDVECPYCGAALHVDDPDDFEDRTRMARDEDHEMVCPVCDESMIVHVLWEPTYPYDAEEVER